MRITYKYLPQIVFPCYKLYSENITRQDGLVFIDTRILDDTNMPGKTLGMRRLLTPRKKELYRLKNGVQTIPDFLSHNLWVDNSGTILRYEKTKVCKLRYYKIKKVELKETASVIWFFDIGFPFKVNRPPPSLAAYARLICFNGIPWLIYDFASEKGKDTSRKV
jgi:hypothetical protein